MKQDASSDEACVASAGFYAVARNVKEVLYSAGFVVTAIKNGSCSQGDQQ